MYLYDPQSKKWYNYDPSQARAGSTQYSYVNDIGNPYGDRYVSSSTPAVSALEPLNNNQSAPSRTPLNLMYAPGSASANLANLTRAQWADYVRRFVPIENELINSTSYENPNVVPEAVATSKAAVNRTFDTAARTQQRAVSQYGLAPDAGQQAVAQRVNNLNRSTAVVDAANRIRQRIADRNREIALGGTPSSGISQGG